MIGGWCEEASIEMDWSGLWRYWQVNCTNSCQHLLHLRQCKLFLSKQSPAEEEFFDAVSWDSMEGLATEFTEERRELPKSVFGEWIEGLIGQVRIEIDGLTVESEAGMLLEESVEVRLKKAIVEAVQFDGIRNISIEEVTTWVADKKVLRTERITGTMQGNQKQSLQLQSGEVTIDYDKYHGRAGHIHASTTQVSISVIEINDFLVASELKMTAGHLSIESIALTTSNIESKVAIPNLSTLPVVPEVCKGFTLSVNSLKADEYEVSKITGKWPEFKVEEVHGTQFSAQSIQVVIDLSQNGSAPPLLCVDQKKFIDNQPVNMISELIPKAAVEVSIQSISLSPSIESSTAKPFPSSLLEFRLPCSVQFRINEASKEQIKAKNCTITLLNDSSIDARIECFTGSVKNVQILEGSLRAVLQEKMLTIEVGHLNACATINTAEFGSEFEAKSLDDLILIPIASIHLRDSVVNLNHSQLAEAVTFEASSIFCFPCQKLAYLEGIHSSIPSLHLKSGMLKFDSKSVSCDEVEWKVIDLKEANSFLQSVQEIVNPPVPITEPQIKWHSTEEEEFDSNEDSSSEESEAVVETKQSNKEVDLDALKDALSSTLLPSSVVEDCKFKFDCKSLSIVCDPFKLNCSASVKYASSLQVTFDHLSFIHQQLTILTRWPRGPLKGVSSFGSSFSDASVRIGSGEEQEYSMDVSLCPLRIKLNSAILSDLLELMSTCNVNSNEQSSHSQSTNNSTQMIAPVAFFSVVKVAPVAIKLDFAPTLQGAHLLLPGATLTGIPGLAGLFSALHRLWLPSLKSRAQVNRMLRSGVAPVRMSMRLGQGVVELIMLPGAVGAQSAARSADDARRAAKKVAGEMIKGTAGVVEKIILVMAAAGDKEEMPRPVAVISQGLKVVAKWD